MQSAAGRCAAEFLGACILTGVVIGSGVLGADLADGNDAVALLANTLATAAILYVLVSVLGPISGAHFNPAVTLVSALRGETRLAIALLYAPLQIAGCICGAMVAHAQFELPLLQAATQVRAGPAQMLSEGVATFALIFAILGGVRHRPQAIPAIVALVIAAGYWWTASTSFANPAITIARAMSDTFAGIRPADAPGFIAAQFVGALVAWRVGAVLFAEEKAG
jgi:glycerol uptake facilitator-like aquaporin